MFADQVGGCRGGEDAPGGGDDAGHAMGGGHAADHLDGTAVAVAAVATHHQGATGDAGNHPQNRLNETLEVVGDFELLAALAKPRCAWLLIGKGLIKCHVQHAAGHRGGPRGHQISPVLAGFRLSSLH